MLIYNDVMWTTYFIAFSLTVLHVSTGLPEPYPFPDNFPNLQPGMCPQSDPQYIVNPQYIPTSGSMFSNEPSVLIFTNTVIEAVYNSKFLRNVFDLSDSTALQYSQFAYKYNLDLLNSDGFDNAESLAEFGVRAIAPNFDVITMPFMVRFKVNLAANFLYVEGILSINNAKSLALAYVEYVKSYAKYGLTADPTSKFYILTDSFLDFISSVDPNAKAMMPLMVWMYGNEWFVAAVNYKMYNQLRNK